MIELMLHSVECCEMLTRMEIGDIFGEKAAQVLELLLPDVPGVHAESGIEVEAEAGRIRADGNVISRLRSLGDSELIEAVAALEQVGQLLDSLRAVAATEVSSRTVEGMPPHSEASLAHRLGFRSAKALLQQVSGASGATIARRLRVGKYCRTELSLLGEELPAKFPHLGAGFVAGQVHIDSADVIARNLASLPAHVPYEKIELAEKVLVSHAIGSELVPGVFDDQREEAADCDAEGNLASDPNVYRDHADEVRTRTAGWMAALDQEGHEPKEEELDRRYFRIGRQYRGLVSIRGAVLPEVAADLGRLFDAVNSPRQAHKMQKAGYDGILNQNGDTASVGVQASVDDPASGDDPASVGEAIRVADPTRMNEHTQTADCGQMGEPGLFQLEGIGAQLASPAAIGSSTTEPVPTESVSTGLDATELMSSEPGSAELEPTELEPAELMVAMSQAKELEAQFMGLPVMNHDHKRHDALALIIKAAMKYQDMPSLGGEAVSLTIQVTEAELLSGVGSAWHVDAWGELSRLDLAAARHAACVGGVLRVTQDHNGRILDLETSARIFNAHQRKAIMARDGGCVIPGCTVSAIWCEIHHVTEYAKGGKTHVDNGALLCWYHHRYLDQHGWQIQMREGVPIVKAPPWLDPAQNWHTARSVHKPPQYHLIT